MLAKLVNNKLKYQESTMIINGEVVCNPSDEILRLSGYKEVVDDVLPEKYGYTSIFDKYEETSGVIYIKYKYQSINLSKLKEAKLLEIKNGFSDEIINTGHIKSSLKNGNDDFEIDARRQDGQNIINLIEYYTEPIPYVGYNSIRANTTLDDLKVFKREMYEFGIQLYNKKWELESRVNAAETAEDLEKIKW